MKRLTATEKWDKAWFRALSLKLKCLWSYICDRCDCAGVWEPDFALASFQIGEPVTESDLGSFGDRVFKLPSGKFLICGFIDFQYGKLSVDSRVHRSVLKRIHEYSLVKVDRDYRYNPILGPGLDPALGLSTQSVPDKISPPKEKEKEKEKVQEGVQGEWQKMNPNFVAAAAECDRIFAQYSKLPVEAGHYDRIWFDLLNRRFLPADVEVYLRWVVNENRQRQEVKYRTRFHVPKMFSDLERFAADLSLAKAWARNIPKPDADPEPDKPLPTAAQLAVAASEKMAGLLQSLRASAQGQTPK